MKQLIRVTNRLSDGVQLSHRMAFSAHIWSKWKATTCRAPVFFFGDVVIVDRGRYAEHGDMFNPDETYYAWVIALHLTTLLRTRFNEAAGCLYGGRP
ncbi:hypothetical protein DND90_32235 [Pseudomonas syringae pv. maculicola]|nr:hypothetical protein DND90_32235 [Pseudomonas syringae pv. maculicola]